MTSILDTHTFIWWCDEPTKLSPAVFAACTAPENTLFLSVVSLWEMQIKIQNGKLTLSESLPQLVSSQMFTNGLRILPLEPAHIWELAHLPLIHKDPFDRLLIAQARTENATLLSADASIAQYSVPHLW